MALSIFGLRHCGRRLPRRDHPSAYGQMGRCLSPCLGDLDPNLYRQRLDEALRLFQGEGGLRLLEHVEAQMRTASAERRFERAAWLRRRVSGIPASMSVDATIDLASEAYPTIFTWSFDSISGASGAWCSTPP